MHCIVTAGPTYEPLDEVRRLTNFSTGKLGTELANYLVSQGHQVTLLLGRQATWRGERRAQSVIEFSTTRDLRERLHLLASASVGALFHAAAVSDFGFGKIWRRSAAGELIELQAGKISSRLDGLLAELVPTPKIIRELRDWFPQACLVGWKYEVDGDAAAATAKAEEQIQASRTSACVVNGPAYGRGFGVVTAPSHSLRVATQNELFQTLERLASAGQGALSPTTTSE